MSQENRGKGKKMGLGDVSFFKSTFSNPSGDCVEVGFQGNGVQVSAKDEGVSAILVRDSKAAETGPVLEFTRAEWTAFIAGVQAGQFDLPRNDEEPDRSPSAQQERDWDRQYDGTSSGA